MIKVELKGWADSINGNKKVEFALQLAMYEVTGDCDWKFEIKITGNSDVRDKKFMSIKATRINSKGYKGNEDDYSLGINYRQFDIIIPEYTMENVYELSVKELKLYKLYK